MQSSAPSDPELLADWLGRQREPAFHALVARYAGLVHATARRTCGDDSMAAEASQLTFIALAQKAKSLTSCASLGGWLHTTAMMQAKNLIRKAQRENRKRQLLQTAMETEPPHASNDIWQEMQPVLDQALAALSNMDREALLLRFYRSLTVREIAATLGIATDAAQKRIDRATDRLRGKLARRGVQTGGSISAAMLAGFAAESQAAVPAISILASKAIASGGVSAGFFPATIAFFTTSMKSIPFIPPLLALTVSASWIGMRREVLAGLEKDGRAMNSSLSTAARTGVAEGAGSRRSMTFGVSHDPKTLLARASGFLLHGGMREAERFFATVPKENILAAMDEISQVKPENRASVEEVLAMVLIRADSAFALEHLIARTADRRQGMTSHLYSALKKWAEEDPQTATAWFDLQMENGTFASKRLDGQSEKRTIFQSALIGGLFAANPELGAARLSALPESLRITFVYDYANESNNAVNREAFTRAVRGLLPPPAARELLKRQCSLIASSDGLSEVSDFLTRLGSTPEERAACFAEAAASRGLHRASNLAKITTKDVDDLRKWVETESPQAVDRITGAALGQIADTPTSNFSDLADLAVAYHESSGNDDVLCAFLESWSARQHPAEASVLAEKISDEKRRAKILQNLK